MRFQAAFMVCVVVLPARAAAAAEAPPPLSDQKAWTRADKAQFLRYLDSNAPPMPAGEVRSAGAPPAEGFASFHRARSAQLGVTYLDLFPYAGGRYGGSARGVGGKLLLERHLRPWIRVYAGLEAEALSQRKRDGAAARLTRWAAPVGVEFALVPLATPQTRYVLLRLGVAPAEVSGPDQKSDFSAPLLGASAAWNVGLGYEWQIPDSSWRLNAAFDGLRSISRPGGVSYEGLSATLGVVRTF